MNGRDETKKGEKRAKNGSEEEEEEEKDFYVEGASLAALALLVLVGVGQAWKTRCGVLSSGGKRRSMAGWRWR